MNLKFDKKVTILEKKVSKIQLQEDMVLERPNLIVQNLLF